MSKSVPEWLPIAQKYPVRYNSRQMPLAKQIRGVVLHTTNAPKLKTIKDVQNSWPGASGNAAHFVIDRDGNIGQCFSLKETAWHVHGGNPKTATEFFGIEHIARHKEGLTKFQFEASARLIGDLSVIFNFPAQPFSKKNRTGIAIHVDFNYTGCGQDVFWGGKGSSRSEYYTRLVKRAQEFSWLGY